MRFLIPILVLVFVTLITEGTTQAMNGVEAGRQNFRSFCEQITGRKIDWSIDAEIASRKVNITKKMLLLPKEDSEYTLVKSKMRECFKLSQNTSNLREFYLKATETKDIIKSLIINRVDEEDNTRRLKMIYANLNRIMLDTINQSSLVTRETNSQ